MDASRDDGLSWRFLSQVRPWDELENLPHLARFQVEVQDRSSGLDRSPQQAEFLTAAGDRFQPVC